MKIVTALFMIIVLSCSVIYGQIEKDSTPTHYCMIMYGKSPFLFGSEKSNDNIALALHPITGNKMFGFNAWYMREDHSSYYEKRKSLVIFQPFMLITMKSLALKLGVNIAIIDDGEVSGFMAMFPAFEIHIGNLHKFFISAGYKSEIFLGLLTAGVHYVFNKNTSQIMIGCGCDGSEINYSAITCGIEHTIFDSLILRLRGNILLKYSHYGIQIGVGMFL